jgi:hypothetical protein
MLICQTFQVGPCARSVQDQRRAQHGKEDRRHAEEPDVKRPHPEIEEIATDQRAAAHPVLSLKTQHGHAVTSQPAQRGQISFPLALGARARRRPYHSKA